MKYLIFLTMPYLVFLVMPIIIPIITGATLTIKSTAFDNNGIIPDMYSCKGTNVNPPLTIEGIPTNTKSLALIMSDPDAPKGTFDHWIMWNIPVTTHIDQNNAPGVQGMNGKKECKYAGPCPPSGTHHYHFKIYALDEKLDLTQNAGKKELEQAMEGHVVATGELIGLFKK